MQRWRAPLFLFLLIVCSDLVIELRVVKPIYAALPTQRPNPAADSALQTRADKLINDAYALYRKGDLSGALDKFTQLLSVYERLGNRKDEWQILFIIGGLYHKLGQLPKALEFFQRALSMKPHVGDQIEGAMLNNIGSIYHLLDQYPKALEFCRQALAIARTLGNRMDEWRILNDIGFVYHNQGQHAKALESYQQALAVIRGLGGRENEAPIVNNIGELYRNIGEYSKALEFLVQAMRLARGTGDRLNEF